MPHTLYLIRDVIAAETAAAEAAIAAEKMRCVGAWHAYAAAEELATARRATADRIRALATASRRSHRAHAAVGS